MKQILIIILLFFGCNNFDIPEKEWRSYMSLTGKQLTQLWVSIYFDTGYEKGKRDLFLNDCSGTFSGFMKGLGAELKTLNAWGYRNELQKYGFKRRTFKDVRPGDIVTFKKSKKEIGHIEIVVKTDKKTGKISCIGHSRPMNGFSYKSYYYNYHRIDGIYMVTPSFFYGENVK